jgi:predicted glycoside hydrolase/deacetylase ChbG (UPF0249 family)
MNVLTLCADDIGQDPLIDTACLELFQMGRLSCVSALSEAPHASNMFSEWQDARQQGLQVGLHFNLTVPFAKNPIARPINTWIALSQCRLIQRNLKRLIKECLNRQLDLFEQQFGFSPDYVDGHQHVHQFPGIRDVLFDVLSSRYSSFLPWLRSTSPISYQIATLVKYPAIFKTLSLSFLGGIAFRKELIQLGFTTNQGFLGVYNFDSDSMENYREKMLQWLSLSQDGALIMCHPASGLVLDDAIGPQRVLEFNYLNSIKFEQDLLRFKLDIKH